MNYLQAHFCAAFAHSVPANITSVSYTHLDVYKRQPMDNEQVGEEVYISMINKAEKYCWFMTPYPVSYTHLLRTSDSNGERSRLWQEWVTSGGWNGLSSYMTAVVSASLNETRDFDCRDLCRRRCAGSVRQWRWSSGNNQLLETLSKSAVAVSYTHLGIIPWLAILPHFPKGHTEGKKLKNDTETLHQNSLSAYIR